MTHRKLGQAIRRHRESRNLTQAELAERAGVLQGQLSNWERANRSVPTIDNLAALERALALPAGALLIAAGYVKLPTSTAESIDVDPHLSPVWKTLVRRTYSAGVDESITEGWTGPGST